MLEQSPYTLECWPMGKLTFQPRLKEVFKPSPRAAPPGHRQDLGTFHGGDGGHDSGMSPTRWSEQRLVVIRSSLALGLRVASAHSGIGANQPMGPRR